MTSEQTTIQWDQFEKKSTGGTFLTLQDKERRVIGVKEIRAGIGNFERKQKDGSVKMTDVPQVHLVLDSLDRKPSNQIFPTGAKYLIAQIKKYHENGNLYRFYISLERDGIGLSTKYTMTLEEEKPKIIASATTPKA